MDLVNPQYIFIDVVFVTAREKNREEKPTKLRKKMSKLTLI